MRVLTGWLLLAAVTSMWAEYPRAHGEGHAVVQNVASNHASDMTANGKGAAHADSFAKYSGYVIGPSDVLIIATWKEPELSETTPVRPDGKIAMPLIGEIQAAGLTAGQLKDVVTAKLKDYIGNPEVNVVVHEIHSQTFNLLGKVVKPGAYPLDRPMSVLDAIALAGGFQDFAKVTKIYVLRRGPNGEENMLPFNYKHVIKGEAARQNLMLRPGDTVVIP